MWRFGRENHTVLRLGKNAVVYAQVKTESFGKVFYVFFLFFLLCFLFLFFLFCFVFCGGR